MAYSLDTSYLVSAWKVWYPYPEFPSVWKVLVSAAARQHLFVVDKVCDELEHQVPDLVEFFDAHANGWKTSTAQNTALQRALQQLEKDLLSGKIIRTYPRQNVRKYISVADPTLVLHAELNGHTVVSDEHSDKLSKKGPKIPDLCDLKGVLHAAPDQFVSVLGHSF